MKPGEAKLGWSHLFSFPLCLLFLLPIITWVRKYRLVTFLTLYPSCSIKKQDSAQQAWLSLLIVEELCDLILPSLILNTLKSYIKEFGKYSFKTDFYFTSQKVNPFFLFALLLQQIHIYPPRQTYTSYVASSLFKEVTEKKMNAFCPLSPITLVSQYKLQSTQKTLVLL